MTIEFTAVAPE